VSLGKDTDTELREVSKVVWECSREEVVGEVEELQRVEGAESGGERASDGVVMKIEEREGGEF
jgi:hypothetical protein